MRSYGKEALIRYKICKNRVQEFLKKEMHADDIPVESINKRLLDKFYLWNRTVYKIGNNTAIHFMHKFSTVYKMPESEYRARKSRKLRRELQEFALANGVPVRS